MKQKVDLGNAVLKGVSRSFYLSIRLLPRLMREPISVGYLLARASDTIADTTNVPVKIKEECLEKFHLALKDEQVRATLIETINARFVSRQENKKEKLLLQRLGDVFGWYDSVREWAWYAISDVMDPILEGQKWDVDYFSIRKEKQVKDEARLDKYCYQVAGCVGEFWGVVGWNAYHRFSKLEKGKLKELGINYGKGLQLVNILRDLPEDLENGRCYLPNIDIKDEETIVEKTEKWRKQAREYLEAGMTYAKSLKQKRTKIATYLPAMIGLKTLDLLDEADWETWQKGVKITRKEVRRCVWSAIFK